MKGRPDTCEGSTGQSANDAANETDVALVRRQEFAWPCSCYALDIIKAVHKLQRDLNA